MAGNVDLVYDQYVAQEKLKNGTKYERIAAIVFCLLREQTVVHDLRLTGASGVAHQIDAVIGAGRKRVLIEAKDYATRVGLGVVRDFFGVVEDLRPDGAYVVTTEGFTGPAKKYAAAKDIHLGILRVPRKGDLSGLVQSILLTINATTFESGTVTWEAADPAEVTVQQLGHRSVGALETTLVQDDGTLETLREVLEAAWGPSYRGVPLGEERDLHGLVRFPAPRSLCIPGAPPIAVSAFEWRGRVVVQASTSELMSDVTAEIVFIDGHDESRRVFTNRDLQGVSWAATE